jgi:hypothetical protein
MRIATLVVTAAFLLASGAAMACPMQSAATSQSVTFSDNSTPIPTKASTGRNG